MSNRRRLNANPPAVIRAAHASKEMRAESFGGARRSATFRLMIITVELPRWGATMQDATIVEWLKQPGDRIAVDESICVVETDKVDAEVPAPAAGVLGEPLVGKGDQVEVGSPLTTIITDG